MCNNLCFTQLMLIKFVPECYNTQEMYGKAVNFVCDSFLID